MATGLSRYGEEFFLDYVFTDGAVRPATIDIGLYDDTTDLLSETDDLNAITTEPVGASYARQSASFPGDFTNSFSSATGNWQTEAANQTFDTSDSSITVNAYFTIINFVSDQAGDSSAGDDHIFFTGDLDSSYSLNQIDSLQATGIGCSINSSGN